MDNTNYLIDHIFNIIIEHSQKDPKFSWGDRIQYTPSEFINILKEHKNELLVSLEERLCNSTRDFLNHAYVKCSRCEKEMTYRSELPRNYVFLHMGEDQKLHYDPKQSECYCVDCFFEIYGGESNEEGK